MHVYFGTIWSMSPPGVAQVAPPGSETGSPGGVLLWALLLVGSAVIGFLIARQLFRARQQQQSAQLEALEANHQAVRASWEVDRARLSARADQLNGELRAARQSEERARTDLAAERTASAEWEKRMLPLQSALSSLREEYADVERARQKAHTELSSQVKTMGEGFTAVARDSREAFHRAAQDVREEARALNRALTRSENRGTWGEMQLRRLVEASGMIDRVHFVEQDHSARHGGAVRPDMVVDLAAGRRVVVDAKVSLDAFLNQPDDSPESAAVARQAHAEAVATHVKQLSRKAYWQEYESPEFVVMFLPAESLLSAALAENPGLMQSAFDQRIILATPTTLMAILQSIAYAWQQDQVADTAREIHDLGVELHRRLRTMSTHFAKMGTALNRSVDAYNATVGSLETRVLPQLRKMESVAEIADGVEVDRVDDVPRRLQAERWAAESELVDSEGPEVDPQDPAEVAPRIRSA